jgi:hypothetical protein
VIVSELRGYKSLRALNAFSALVLGLKMLPAYMGEQYEDFLKRLQGMPEADQRAMLTHAAQFVELQKEEVEALVCFCRDGNGVPFSAENIKSLPPAQLIDAIVSVCMEIVKIRIDFVSDSEKKN